MVERLRLEFMDNQKTQNRDVDHESDNPFPGDYFSPNAPNENFSGELDAVVATDGLEAVLFNFDGYIESDSLVLGKLAEHLPRS